VDGEGMVFKTFVKLDVMPAAIELIVNYEDIMEQSDLMKT
jgi:hypothetical protein